MKPALNKGWAAGYRFLSWLKDTARSYKFSGGHEWRVCVALRLPIRTHAGWGCRRIEDDAGSTRLNALHIQGTISIGNSLAAMEYHDLVAARKRCRLCMDGDARRRYTMAESTRSIPPLSVTGRNGWAIKDQNC
jgi:hypothetical protein